ncbi:MAG: hypothetical protein P4L74_06720 [Candidatus Doudnabacteria bacterium]|nr:hypothetical protein [Candidatus Doudnabacteria bacterium]
MQGVEIGHCDAAIKAALTANYTLLGSTVEDVLQAVDTYGKSDKKDTLGLDARPEIDIVQIMRAYDDNSVVITEEIGSQGKMVFTHTHDPRAFRTIYISDPTDRSAYLKKFLATVPDKNVKVKNVIGHEDAVANWEKLGGSPASITGAFCALSCIRHAVPIFSVLVNYITQELFVSCSAGNYMLAIPQDRPPIDLQYVRSHGTKLYFPALRCPYNDDARRFVTFVGKEGYRENLLDSKLMSENEIENLLHYKEPGGPSRILYLSSLQPKGMPIGFILANGEKIGEWIHWLPWISFARKEDDQGEAALSLFEIYRKDQVRMKGEVLMSTAPFYSIFKKRDAGTEQMLMDIPRFSDFDNPSRIRATLIACPTGNTWATGLVKQFGYRPVQF